MMFETIIGYSTLIGLFGSGISLIAWINLPKISVARKIFGRVLIVCIIVFWLGLIVIIANDKKETLIEAFIASTVLVGLLVGGFTLIYQARLGRSERRAEWMKNRLSEIVNAPDKQTQNKLALQLLFMWMFPVVMCGLGAPLVISCGVSPCAKDSLRSEILSGLLIYTIITSLLIQNLKGKFALVAFVTSSAVFLFFVLRTIFASA